MLCLELDATSFLERPIIRPCELRSSTSIRLDHHLRRSLWGATHRLPIRTSLPLQIQMRLPASERENRRYPTTSRTVSSHVSTERVAHTSMCYFRDIKSIVESTYFCRLHKKHPPVKTETGATSSTCRSEKRPHGSKPIVTGLRRDRSGHRNIATDRRRQRTKKAGPMPHGHRSRSQVTTLAAA